MDEKKKMPFVVVPRKLAAGLAEETTSVKLLMLVILMAATMPSPQPLSPKFLGGLMELESEFFILNDTELMQVWDEKE